MKNKIYISLLAGALTLTGCSEEFLETETTQYASGEQIIEGLEKDPSLQAASLRGLYSTMVAMESGGTTGHDDFGHKGYDIYGDMLTGDMVLAAYGYGWYRTIVEYQTTTDFTNQDNYQVWRFYYRLIFGANSIIEDLGGNDAVPEDAVLKANMGQAKAIRGFAYFYLAQYFGSGYKPSEAIVPLYLTSDVEALPLSTTAEVYEVVIGDLEDAVELLADFNRAAKNEINQDVAKGLLAYAYAAMGDYEAAKPLAADLVANYDVTGRTEVVFNGDNLAQAGFNDVTDPTWIWGQDITLDLGLDLVSWWGVVDNTTYSYAWAGDPKVINADLYDAIDDSDIRKGQWVHVAFDADGVEYWNEDLDGDGELDGLLYPINKFYHEARVPAGQREVTTDYIYMRSDEFYLLLAESAAKTGDEGTAKSTLKTLLAERVDDPSYVDALSGQALLDEIYLQTRIELWGEGKSYLAMKRNQATVTLPENHLSFPGASYSYDSDEMTFEIPQLEVQNNPFID